MQIRNSVSIVIPAFNESECLDELTTRLKSLFLTEGKYAWEVIIIENGSTDSTWNKLLDIAQEDERFKILKLSRNFRMDGGLTAGLEYVNSDACVLMTADLQDPPEMISQFLRKWEEGFENIYGVIKKRKGTNVLRKINSVLFYKIVGKMTNRLIPENASDFRLVDRKVYEAVREMNERNRFVRGLFAWVGFKSIGIPMDRPERYAGKSNADTFKVLELAIKGLFAYSYKPLRFISLAGLIISLMSLVAIIVLAVLAVFVGVPFAGFGTIVALIIGGFGFQTLLLGIVSEYLGLVYEESKGRPNFIVSEKIGF
jgi:glycosyltransferase involved in cell wall biosynthesis